MSGSRADNASRRAYRRPRPARTDTAPTGTSEPPGGLAESRFLRAGCDAPSRNQTPPAPNTHVTPATGEMTEACAANAGLTSQVHTLQDGLAAARTSLRRMDPRHEHRHRHRAGRRAA